MKRKRKRTASRAVKKRVDKKVRSKRSVKNPKATPRYFITARRTPKSPVMHFDGKNFSQRKEKETFSSQSVAFVKARGLIQKYPILRGYLIAVETQHRP